MQVKLFARPPPRGIQLPDSGTLLEERATEVCLGIARTANRLSPRPSPLTDSTDYRADGVFVA
jgi:hypothetical protein